MRHARSLSFRRLNRRQFLGASAAAVPLISAFPSIAQEPARAVSGSAAHHGGDVKTLSKLAAPGLYPGQVVEGATRGCAVAAFATRGHRSTLDKGMKELTGATDAVEAWKHFFEPGDVVGIKVVPNGQPDAHSSFEIVLEVIEKLRRPESKPATSSSTTDIAASSWRPATRRSLPDGVRWGGLDPVSNQFQMDFPDFRNDPIAGFDHDAFVWMDLVPYGDDPKDERKYRSHLGKLVTKTRQQDRRHPCAQRPRLGRSHRRLEEHEPRHGQQCGPLHSNSFTNVCNQFIPQVITPPGHPPEVCAAHHGRHPRRLSRRPVLAREREVDLGKQRDPVRDRPGGARPRRMDPDRRPAGEG